ncbi:4371_t:CDS:2 [Ambispora leptoticha]|uniref:4371_t:CDS:1 n=1 Tax=Ambispora leptoticha TaxID=144679 RepID=A0A9N8ZFC8_9GLOM|nr:4371_t:CDS:2 [Ambispora leptoticha]
MAANKNLTHDDPSGDLGKRLDHQGFDWWSAGENIARGFEENDDVGVMRAWMNSPGHRANILNSRYTHFGAGYKDTYWTQNFAQDVNGRPPNVPRCPTETKSKDGAGE